MFCSQILFSSATVAFRTNFLSLADFKSDLSWTNLKLPSRAYSVNTALIERRIRPINLAFLWRLSIKTYDLQTCWDVQKLLPYERTDFKIRGYCYADISEISCGAKTAHLWEQPQNKTGQLLPAHLQNNGFTLNQNKAKSFEKRIQFRTFNRWAFRNIFHQMYEWVWGGQLRFVGFPETPPLILFLMKGRRESWQKVGKRKTKLIATVSAINWVWDM